MKYLGGKSRIAKQIGSFLNSEIERLKPIKYIEPFCGGCWITQEINPNIERIACDIHKDLILLWRELQKGYVPPETITEEEYEKFKNSESSALRGFIGFGSSWGAKWFGGYARCKTHSRNYTKEARNTLLKKIQKLQNVHFKCCSYEIIQNIENRLIYCDPPYQGTTIFKNTPDFDYNKFWNWCRELSKNNYVYISEYQSPSDFNAILEIPVKTDYSTKDGKEYRIEKLFKYKNV